MGEHPAGRLAAAGVAALFIAGASALWWGLPHVRGWPEVAAVAMALAGLALAGEALHAAGVRAPLVEAPGLRWLNGPGAAYLLTATGASVAAFAHIMGPDAFLPGGLLLPIIAALAVTTACARAMAREVAA